MSDILIIEDETALLDALTDGLGNAFPNMAVRGTTSAEDALPFIMQSHPLLIISDIKLPGKSGIDFLIETRRRWPGIKFILMSAFAVLTREQALARGAFRLIRKPFPLKELVNSVREALEDKTFKGNVEGISLIDLMQLIHLGRKTTALFIAKAGEIYFKDGEIVHAVADNLEGIEAFYALMHLGGGHFSTKAEREPEKMTISESFEYILLEAVKIMDEETLDDLELEEVDVEPLPQPRYVDPPKRRKVQKPGQNGLIMPKPRKTANSEANSASIPVPKPTHCKSKLAEACKSFAEGLDGIHALGVVDISSGLLVGSWHCPNHFSSDHMETIAAALSELVGGKTMRLVEKMLTQPNGTAQTTEEMFFSTQDYFYFSKVVAEKPCQLIMITRKAFNQGMGWATLRTAVDEIKNLLP